MAFNLFVTDAAQSDLADAVEYIAHRLGNPFAATTVPLGKPLDFSQFSSVAQSCQTLCNPMDCSSPGVPVYHQLPEFTQTQVH